VSWPTVALSELIVEEIGGISLGRDDFFDQGFPVIPKKAVSADIEICEKSYAYTTHEIFSSYAKSFVDNSFVITVLRDLVPSGPNLGRVCLLRESKNYLLAQGVYGFKLAPECDPRYLAYISNTPNFREQVLRFKVGSTQVHVRGSEYKKVAIPLPPLLEQKRIAAILDKADAIRRKRQQAIKLADDFLSAEFLERFGDPKDSPFGSKSLKEVTLKITDGAHFTPTYVDSGIPFLRVTDINRDKVDWSQVKYIPLEEHQELIKRCRPEKGDVLYSKNGTIGVPKLIDWDQEFSIFVSLCLIKPDPNFLRGRYLYSFLQTPFALKQATQKAKSATVTNLHLIEIKEIKLPVPSLTVQDEWIDFVSRFNDTRARLIQSLEKSNEVFSSLSQKAFSGDL
jgi:type I restriction enzyme, S subunit